MHETMAEPTMGDTLTSVRGREAQNARHALEALHRRNRPSAAYRGVRHSLDEHLRLVGLMRAYGGALAELARELDVSLEYVRALEAYHNQWMR